MKFTKRNFEHKKEKGILRYKKEILDSLVFQRQRVLTNISNRFDVPMRRINISSAKEFQCSSYEHWKYFVLYFSIDELQFIYSGRITSGESTKIEVTGVRWEGVKDNSFYHFKNNYDFEQTVASPKYSVTGEWWFYHCVSPDFGKQYKNDPHSFEECVDLWNTAKPHDGLQKLVEASVALYESLM